ncbi:MAG: FHA domain-containing protein [Rhodoglobus sp.]
MTSIQFQPAATDGWLAIVSQNRALVIETADESFLREAWIAVAADDAVQPVLELLTRRGLSSTPAFAFVVLGEDSSLRVVLRGSLTVAVTDATGDHELSSAGVSTWLERIFEGTTGATISAPKSTAASVGSLPLVSGVAWVSTVTLGSTSSVTAVEPPAEVVAAAATRSPATSSPAVAVTELDAPVPQPTIAPAAPAIVPVFSGEPAFHQVLAEEPQPEPVAEQPEPEPVAEEPAPEPAPASEFDIEATVTDEQIDQLAPPPPPVVVDAAPTGFDLLFGATIHRTDETDAAAPEPEKAPAPQEASFDQLIVGDHDGHTVLTSDIQKLRGDRAPQASVTAPPPPPVTATISIVQPGGAKTPLVQTVIIGRAPSVSKVSGEYIPTLLTIEGDQDISRNHAQISLEGGTPVVTDLHSRNGTSVVIPGRSPQRLRAGEATAVIIGTVIDLGGGVTLTLEED